MSLAVPVIKLRQTAKPYMVQHPIPSPHHFSAATAILIHSHALRRGFARIAADTTITMGYQGFFSMVDSALRLLAGYCTRLRHTCSCLGSISTNRVRESLPIHIRYCIKWPSVFPGTFVSTPIQRQVTRCTTSIHQFYSCRCHLRGRGFPERLL